MIKKLAIYFAIVAACIAAGSCNRAEEDVRQTATSAAVSGFSIQKDDSVLANLDSVFFSIDLVRGLIFNADSMPVGTDVTHLIPTISTLNGCAEALLTVSRAGKADTTYNYLTNPSDSIDFTNPVKLRITSPDGLTTRNYTIYVNVHKVDADSLEWARIDRRSLPSTFAYPTSQHTTRGGDRLYCLTEYMGNYCLATLENDLMSLNGPSPDLGTWEKIAVDFPVTPLIDTFTATEDELFIIGDDLMLYSSGDGGASWTATGMTWSWIYGAYGSELLGYNTDGKVQSYPSEKVMTLPTGMPVSGTSSPNTYEFAMSDVAQMLVVGGRRADGTLSPDTWGYDGNSWARVSKRALPAGIEYPAVAAYYTFNVRTDWNVTTYPTLVLIGGRLADGTINTTVYISNDYGFNWMKAGDKLQLPSYMPALYSSQAIVISSTLHGNVNLPKISKPSETWECPYIYLFGGINADGNTSNNVWRGVINRLKFKPVE